MSFENEHIKSEEFIKGLKRSGGFEIPEDYFESNFKVLQQIPLDPALDIEKTATSFDTPPHYFENLSSQIFDKVNQPKQAKKISLSFSNNWMKIAAAIALFGVIGLGMMKLNTPKQTDTAKLEDLSEEEIIDHLSSSGYGVDMLCDAGWCDELKKLDNNSDIENYLMEDGNELELMSEING